MVHSEISFDRSYCKQAFREIYDRKEWGEIRMPIMKVMLNVIDIDIRYGPPINRTIVEKMLEVLRAEFK